MLGPCKACNGLAGGGGGGGDGGALCWWGSKASSWYKNKCQCCVVDVECIVVCVYSCAGGGHVLHIVVLVLHIDRHQCINYIVEF